MPLVERKEAGQGEGGETPLFMPQPQEVLEKAEAPVAEVVFDSRAELVGLLAEGLSLGVRALKIHGDNVFTLSPGSKEWVLLKTQSKQVSDMQIEFLITESQELSTRLLRKLPQQAPVSSLSTGDLSGTRMCLVVSEQSRQRTAVVYFLKQGDSRVVQPLIEVSEGSRFIPVIGDDPWLRSEILESSVISFIGDRHVDVLALQYLPQPIRQGWTVVNSSGVELPDLLRHLYAVLMKPPEVLVVDIERFEPEIIKLALMLSVSGTTVFMALPGQSKTDARLLLETSGMPPALLHTAFSN